MASNNDIPAFSNIKLMQTPTDNSHAARLIDVDNKITALGVGTISSNLSTHVADTSVHVPVQNSAGYVFLSDTTATSSGTWTEYTTSVTQNSSALVTSGAVWSAINALSTTYAPASHTHAASAITSGTFDSARIPTATSSVKGGVIVGDGITVVTGVISVDVGDGLAIDSTSKKVKISLASSSYLTVGSSGLGVDTTNLKTGLGLGSAAYVDTGAMTGTSADSGKAAVLNSSGKIASAALPSANGSSAAGIVTQGNGVTITAGSLTVKAGNGIQVSSSGVAIKLDTNSGLSVSSNGLKVDTTNLATILSLGTAAGADTGTAEGNVPVLDSNGKLATSVLPALAVTDTFVKSSEAGMLAITGANQGDVCVRTDLNKTFILTEDGASTLSHWQELLTPTDAVTSVNGATGAVSITLAGLGGLPSSYLETTLTANSDVKVPSSKAVATYVSNNAIPSSYLETTLTTSSDVKVPSSKAVYTYVNTNYAAKTHNHAAGDINSGTLASARLPAATTSAKGAVIVGGGLKVSSGTVSIDFLAASNGTYDTTNDTKAITAKAAKSIADTAAATAAKGYAGTITGDGSTTAFDVTHNLGTANVLVQIYDTDGDPCLVSYTRATNKITVNFASAPANNASFAVMIIAVS